MKNNNQLVKVQIFGRNYSVRGGSDTDYIHNLASYVNEKMNEIAQATQETRFGDIAALACLNIADEFSKAKHEGRKKFEILRNKMDDLLVKINNKIAKET